jgi:hypothetical protein
MGSVIKKALSHDDVRIGNKIKVKVETKIEIKVI